MSHTSLSELSAGQASDLSQGLMTSATSGRCCSLDYIENNDILTVFTPLEKSAHAEMTPTMECGPLGRRPVSEVVAALFAVIHFLLGCVSVLLGFGALTKSEKWLAHSVCPIWAGAVFIITGIAGLLAVRKRTMYLILCYGAFSLAAVITAVVSIQLLRLGLVNHTADGRAFQKEEKDDLIIAALVCASLEIFFSFLTLVACWRMGTNVGRELKRKHEGTFYVQVVGDKDILVINNPVTANH